MNIFETIVKDGIERKNALMDKIKASLRREKSGAENEKLLKCAEECASLLKDGRYVYQQEFLKEAVESLRDALQFVLARDVKNIDRKDTLVKAVAIAAQIEAFQSILSRPEKVAREMEEYRKMVKKGEKNDY